jgi:hypothetical protein
MKTAWYFLLIGCLLFISAGPASAQRFVAVVPSPPENPAQFVQPDPPSPVPDDGTWAQGWPGSSDSQEPSSGSAPLETKAGPQEVYGYATGDKNFVASQYMDYDKALALGKQILAEQQATPKPASTQVVQEVPQHPAAPAPADSKGIVVEQDNDGKLVECKGNNSTCHAVN